MRKVNKWLALLFAIIMIASIGLAGCGKAADDKATTDAPKTAEGDKKTDEPKVDVEQVLNYNLGAEPTSLDSTVATYAHDFLILSNVQEGLVRLNLKQETEGAMAESWDVSDDKLTYTFHLRDAKWSNGDPVTAQDFEYGWKLALNPKTASQYGFIFATANIAGANDYNSMADATDEELQAAANNVGVKALDPKTLQVTLAAPSPFFLDLTSFATFFPVNQKFYESLEAGTYGTDSDKLLYNGPFVVSEWNHDQSVKISKNENYWDANTVKISDVNFSIVTDSNTAFNLYLSGDLDSNPVPEQFLEQYKDDPNSKFEPETRTFWLYTNMAGEGVKGEYLKNKNFREALAIGFDRQQFVDVISGGQYGPAFGILPPGIRGTSKEKDFIEEFARNVIKEDAKKAKELVAKALEEVGKPLPELELLIGDNDLSLKIAQFLQEQWKQAGVTITVNQQPSKIQKELRKTGKFDLNHSGWGADYNDPSTFLDLFTSDNSFNELKFSDARYDELVKGAAKEKDEAKRMQMYAEAEQILLSSYSVIPTYHRAQYVLRAPYVKDVAYYAVGADECFKWAYVEGK